MRAVEWVNGAHAELLIIASPVVEWWESKVIEHQVSVQVFSHNWSLKHIPVMSVPGAGATAVRLSGFIAGPPATGGVAIEIY